MIHPRLCENLIRCFSVWCWFSDSATARWRMAAYVVAYASRAMTSAETRYAQIEKELLCIMFACERFHQSLNDCQLRIQRLMIRLKKYTLNVSYTPGKFVHTADTVSRATDPNEVQSYQKKMYTFMLTWLHQTCPSLVTEWTNSDVRQKIV